MPVLRSARALAEAPITTVKKNPIDAKVKSLQDQLAMRTPRMSARRQDVAHAEVARVTEVKDAKIESLTAGREAQCERGRARRERAARRPADEPRPVAQGGWVTRDTPEDLRPRGPRQRADVPKEPAVLHGADKPIKIELELTNDAGEKVTPLRGARCRRRSTSRARIRRSRPTR